LLDLWDVSVRNDPASSVVDTVYAWDFNSASASDALTAWPGFRNNSANTAAWRPETIFKNDFD